MFIQKALDLDHVADLRIGDPNDVVEERLSGGERKRLSIALATLSQPSVLIADGELS